MEPESCLAALVRMGLSGPNEHPAITPLTGGVSSDIFRVDLQRGPVCVKRALPKLKVQADWRAPVERNRYESAWMRTAGSIVPDAVPRILGEDPQAQMFAMEYLAPERFPVWKSQLRDGMIEPDTARQVGRNVALIHARTAGNLDVARQFATDNIFLAIRLEPYLSATAERHPQCAQRLASLVRITLATKRALVHGDVSPKNILIGPRGPVFLDAECAWYGDPAFDLAFCANHLLLKCLWRPHWAGRYLKCFDALTSGYLDNVTWEPRIDIEARCAHLLAGLFLGRVDGKSPVEYLDQEAQRELVRQTAISWLRRPQDSLGEMRNQWHAALAR